MKFCILVSEFNTDITGAMLESAKQVFKDHKVDVHNVPGAFELPVAAKHFAQKKMYDGILCLGCVIRGETSHFDFISDSCAHGLKDVSLEFTLPVTFGVLTTENRAQAVERSSGSKNKGREVAEATLRMSELLSEK